MKARTIKVPAHYSKVLVELPDSTADPSELIVTIDCDVCGTSEFRTHAVHFGTLVRVLSDTFNALGGDSGDADIVASWEPSSQKAKVLKYMNEMFPGWKASRLKGTQ